MSRRHGPLWKKSRALNFSLLGNKKEFSRGKKRTSPPGMHGAKRKRLSTYALQNREKQKLRYFYGLKEKQLYNLFAKLKNEKGDTGDNLLIDCESRLDNLVFKAGLVNTFSFARHLVSYKHILVDGKTVNIPSYKIEPGQVISLKKEKMKENKLIKDNLEQNLKVPPYIAFDKQKLTITYLHYPAIAEINKEKGIDTSLIVEWYNRKV